MKQLKYTIRKTKNYQLGEGYIYSLRVVNDRGQWTGHGYMELPEIHQIKKDYSFLNDEEIAFIYEQLREAIAEDQDNENW